MPVSEESAPSQCKVCFMQSFEPGLPGLSRSYARTSVDSQRSKHTSAPRQKVLLGPAQEITRTMKKSMVGGATAHPPPKPFAQRTLAFSQASPPHSQLAHLSQLEAMVKKDRLCEVCRLSEYSITRVDKKKVCKGCYNK